MVHRTLIVPLNGRIFADDAGIRRIIGSVPELSTARAADVTQCAGLPAVSPSLYADEKGEAKPEKISP